MTRENEISGPDDTWGGFQRRGRGKKKEEGKWRKGSIREIVQGIGKNLMREEISAFH